MTDKVSYKLKSGDTVIAYVDDGKILISKESLEIMVDGWNKGYEKGHSDGIGESLEKIKTILVDGMQLENATKYGNENAEQQEISYGTLMRYEIAYYVDDLIDDLECMKGQK